MKIVLLLLSFMSSTHSGIAHAVAPIFQLPTHQIKPHRSTQNVDDNARTASPNIDRVSFQQAISASSQLPPHNAAIASRAVFIAFDKSFSGWRYSDAAMMEFRPPPEKNHLFQKAIWPVNVTDDSLYYFLRGFKERTPQKPTPLTLLFIGLCLLLYQLRSRPVRVLIRLHSASVG